MGAIRSPQALMYAVICENWVQKSNYKKNDGHLLTVSAEAVLYTCSGRNMPHCSELIYCGRETVVAVPGIVSDRCFKAVYPGIIWRALPKLIDRVYITFLYDSRELYDVLLWGLKHHSRDTLRKAHH